MTDDFEATKLNFLKMMNWTLCEMTAVLFSVKNDLETPIPHARIQGGGLRGLQPPQCQVENPGNAVKLFYFTIQIFQILR